jgi:hypothetical protein
VQKVKWNPISSHGISEDRMAAQGQMIEAILQSISEAVN